MSISFLHSQLFVFNKPEPMRQSALLMTLATSLGNGRAMLESLDALAADAKGEWQGKLKRFSCLLEDGSPLSEACMAVQGITPLQTQMAIRVAEPSGALKQVLSEEAHRLMQESRDGANGAKIPSLIFNFVIFALLIMFVISYVMIFLIPKFLDIFEGFEVSLPQSTRALINTSNWILAYWPIFILPVFTIAGYIFFFTFYSNWKYLTRGEIPLTQRWPRYWTPDVLRAVGISVSAKQPIDNALQTVQSDMRPGKAATALSSVCVAVQNGADVWEAMKKNGLIKSSEVQTLQAAEAAGNLDWAAMNLAEKIRSRRQNRLEKTLTILQPVAVFVIGLSIGLIVYSLYAPLMKLMFDLSLVG